GTAVQPDAAVAVRCREVTGVVPAVVVLGEHGQPTVVPAPGGQTQRRAADEETPGSVVADRVVGPQVDLVARGTEPDGTSSQVRVFSGASEDIGALSHAPAHIQWDSEGLGHPPE